MVRGVCVGDVPNYGRVLYRYLILLGGGLGNSTIGSVAAGPHFRKIPLKKVYKPQNILITGSSINFPLLVLKPGA